MLVEIITPDAKLFEGEVNSIKLPGTNGGFEILNNHAPIISTLTAGKISIASDNGQKSLLRFKEALSKCKTIRSSFWLTKLF